MLAALLIAATLTPCEASYQVGREAVAAIGERYLSRDGARLLEAELGEAINAREFDGVCHDPQAFALAFSQTANIIARGEGVRLRPVPDPDRHGRAARLAAAASTGGSFPVFETGGDRIGRLLVTDFPPLPEAGARIEDGLANLRSARSLIIRLDEAFAGETETALALFAAIAPGAALMADIAIETRLGPELHRASAPARWPRLSDDLQIFIVISGDTGAAGQALATLLRLHAGAFLVGQPPSQIGDLIYETQPLSHGYEIEIAAGRYQLGETDGWPSYRLEPDIRVGPLSEAVRRAGQLAVAAADFD